MERYKKWHKKAANWANKNVVQASKDYIASVTSSFSLANYVNKTHYTTPTLMLDAGPLFGKVGFSVTQIKQDKDPGLAHTYSNIGNDEGCLGAGISLLGWLGADVGVSTECNLFVRTQITPWVHYEQSSGLDGYGQKIGIDFDEYSYDFEIKGGLGLALILIAPELIPVGIFSTPATAF